MSHLRLVRVPCLALAVSLGGCGGGGEPEGASTSTGSGGSSSGGGTPGPAAGGAGGSAGSIVSEGGTPSGGTPSGGTPSGGATATGGAASGGAPPGGGTGAGGTTSGGAATGGATGGTPPATGGAGAPGTGGALSGGGTADGGTTAGGTTTGGVASGGAPATGGAASDCVDTPPPNGETCEHAVEWGWCDDDWMAGACALSCGACEGGTGGAGIGGGSATGGAGTGGDGTGGASTGGNPGTGGASGGSTFPECRFHFGVIDSYARDNAGIRAEVDYFTPGWMGQKDTFDMQYVCEQANPGGQLEGILPVIVSYVIAFTARRDENLQDCNVGSPSLCDYGATYLRAHLEDRILPIYRAYAEGFAGCWGTTKPIVFLMEPDFYQYNAGGDPNSLSPAEAGQIMGRLVETLRQALPNAVFSLDISPWIPNQGAEWYANFELSDFTFINTSGGGTEAGNDRIRSSNDMTWAGVHGVTGKPILADTGYGVAGTSAGHDAAWDVPGNINARIANGVIGINQYNPKSDWGSTIAGIRDQLDSVPCP